MFYPNDEADFNKLYPTPKLLHRLTETLADGVQQETSLYQSPLDETVLWIEQVLFADDWEARHRLTLPLRLVAVFLPHLQRIVEGC